MFRWLLYPFSILYKIIIKIRNFLYDINLISSKEFNQTIITIGNLSVGGTGKTPHTEFLINLLKDSFNIAVLSRGYKRKSKGFVLADNSSTYKDIGDEPKQIYSKFPDTKVAVCINRIEGINKLLEIDKEIDIFLLDDAFQHRKLKPSFAILLTEYNNLFCDDYMLPFGRLRDSVSEYHRANIIIITKCPKKLTPIERRIVSKKINLLPYQVIYFTYIEYDVPTPLFKNTNNNFLTSKIKSNLSILIISGIANSTPFVDYIKNNISKNITHLKFPDHFSYKKNSIKKIISTFAKIINKNKIIITTEKDAVRLQDNIHIDNELKNKIYYIPIRIRFLFNSKNEFNHNISKYVRKNKANYKLLTSKNQF